MTDWDGLLQAARERFERAEEPLSRATAAGAAGLAELMRGGDAATWLGRAADEYRASWGEGSWGRPIGAIKSRVLAGDWDGAADDARWALELGAAETDTAIGRYAAALACAVLDDWRGVRVHADFARTHETFPNEVADALAFVSAEDVVGYVEAVEDVLESFETRDAYLEDMPVADTVLVLQALAARRGMAAELDSPLLP
ncbi:MAG TPA: hypothetical protein VML35_05050 [Gaiellaceae bacterium]|nr:hypothetical protein [Gaiellaceae bacterium]